MMEWSAEPVKGPHSTPSSFTQSLSPPVFYTHLQPLTLHPALQINCRTTAVTSGGDGLAVAMIGNITCSEDVRDVGHHMFNREDIASLIHRDDTFEELGIGFVTYRNKNALSLYRYFFTGDNVA